jgi:RNA polymerase sigma-70 factor (ECF subfamily)
VGGASLQARLVTKLQEARAAWPGLSVGDGEYLEYVTERLPAGDRMAALETVHVHDLYLACGCAQGDKVALRAFEGILKPEVAAALARLRCSASTADEVGQIIRTRVLVTEGGVPPRIAGYLGQGSLRSWVRVMATREALMILRKARSEPDAVDAHLLEAETPEDDPEIAHFKRVYRSEFEASFRVALATLTPRERNLLRQSFVHGLTVARVGALYKVHGATASRWIAQAREKLLAATKQELIERLQIETHELESIMRLIRSRLDVSLRELEVKRKPLR